MVQYYRVPQESSSTPGMQQNSSLNNPTGTGSMSPKPSLDIVNPSSLVFGVLPKKFQILYFIASVLTIFCGVFGFLDYFIIPLEPLLLPFDTLSEFYLIIFGILLFILDVPLGLRWVREMRVSITKNCKWITRLTGKGCFLMFVGASVFNCMYIGEVSQYLGIGVGGYLGVLGVITLSVGLYKSTKLHRVRKSLNRETGYGSNWNSIISNFCRNCQSSGITSNSLNDIWITLEEFNHMSKHISGIQFNTNGNGELALICSAVSHELMRPVNADSPSMYRPEGALTLKDIELWLKYGVVV